MMAKTIQISVKRASATDRADGPAVRRVSHNSLASAIAVRQCSAHGEARPRSRWRSSGLRASSISGDGTNG